MSRIKKEKEPMKVTKNTAKAARGTTRDNKKKKNTDKNIKAMMPWIGVTMSGDMIEVEPTVFAKTYELHFPSPLAANADNRAMYEDLIDKGSSSAQITGYRKNGEFRYYVTFSAKADMPDEAENVLSAYADRYQKIFKAYECDAQMTALPIADQLELMHSILNAGHGSVAEKLGCPYTVDAAKKAHLTTKDLVAPSYMKAESSFIEVDDGVMGIAFLNSTTKRVNGDLFQAVEAYPYDMLYTVHLNRFDPAKALKVIDDEIKVYADASRPKTRREQNEELVRKNKKKKNEEQVKYPNFEDIAIKEAYTGIFKDAIEAEEGVAQVTIEFVFFADTQNALDEAFETLDTREMRLHYKILFRDYYQKRAMKEILPLNICDGTLSRVYTLTSASIFFPFPLSGYFETEDINAVSSPDDFYTAKQKAPSGGLKKRTTTEVHSTVQDSIPIHAVYLADGIFETTPGVFTKAYRFSDINYHTATEQDQNEFLQKYASLLNRFDSTTRFQIVLNNKNVDIKRFKQDTLLPPKGDGLDVYRSEYNAIIMDKMTEGRNNISKECYLIVSTEAEDLESAKRIFNRLDPEIMTSFKEIGGSSATVMTTEERLESLYDIYNLGHEGTFMSAPDIAEGIVKADDVQNAVSCGITARDLIAPSGLRFLRDWIKIGDKYARVVYLENYPNSLSDKFLSELTGVNCNMLVSLSYVPVRQDKAVKMVRHQMLNINANVQDAQKQASKNGYSMELLPYDLKVASEESSELLTDLTGRNQKLFYLTLTVLVMADSKEELETNTEIVLSTGRKYLCGFKKLPYQQEDALNATLPFCVNRLAANRTLTTNASVIFQPFDAQDITDRKGGMYYGQNATSHNLIILNRRNSMNANGWILGTPGSGKSFAAKSEMTNVLLNTDDDVLVIDPEREYGPLAKAYGGSIVRIAPGSRYHLNPLDMDKDYADDDNPITLKSDFMLSICESVLGGRYGLNPTQVALIDRCVNLIYRDYLEHGYDEKYIPTLIDFQAILEAQPEHEARELALALEVYTKGSLDVFAHHSNVDINNRFVIYDIKDIGSKLREFGYLVVLNAVWNRVIKNRKLGKKTWIYIDEVYLLFTKDESTQFIRQIFSRCRKWGGAITAITQNVEPILQNTAATTMLSNSDFIMLLNQAPVDRDILASLLHISPTNASYLSNCPPGSGLFVLRGQSGGTGTTVIPFRSTMPKGIAPNLYRVQTSKPDEILDEFK